MKNKKYQKLGLFIILFFLLVGGIGEVLYYKHTPHSPANNKIPQKETLKEKQNQEIQKNQIHPSPQKETAKEQETTSTIEKQKETPEEKPKEPAMNPDKQTNTSPTPPNETPKELTIEQKNDQLRKDIERKYGITIKYSTEMGNYRPRGYTPNYMTDPNQIASYLQRLNKTLSYYPVHFFKDIKESGMSLSIYLIQSVPNNAFAGLTDHEFYDDIKMTITTTGFFERLIHHEMMHYIDAYLEIKMYPQSPYLAYEQLNPSGFQYGTTNHQYSYHITNHQRGAYFINDYGQTNVREDRATIFEDIMSRAYPPTGCYEKGEIIYQKATLITQQIETYFPSITNTKVEHWSRFLS